MIYIIIILLIFSAFFSSLETALFHLKSTSNKNEIVKIDNHQVTGLFCEFRNNTPDEQLQSGMGDIFIKLAR